ncbi:MAG: phosphomannomutase/phosphoglucomutase [Spirochaetes bacterium]|nr:MAG: phosphomannomutase/phosphoglucomutase [Spirochaetota bacterium]
MNIFKDNDIRGLYPQDWNRETAYRIGYLIPEVITGRNIVIGRDGRESSKEIFQSIAEGLNDRGVDVIDIGVVDTPAVYFTVGYFGYDGAIMITASHNPVGYNGLKLTEKNAIPIDSKNGLDLIKSLLNTSKEIPFEGKGDVLQKDISLDYCNYLKKFRPQNSRLKAVYDCSNGSIASNIHAILKDDTDNSILINDRVIGDFPNHGPNPTLPENLVQLQDKIKETRADIGFCFDGDGDRVVIVDNDGEIVSPDLITALIGIYYFKLFPEKREGNNKVLVDIRSSQSVSESLENIGAEVIACPVGHSKIKKIMRAENALFAGELTGHYYFSENYYSDSAWISVFRILTVLSEGDLNLRDLKAELLKYGHSGEINFTVKDSGKLIDKLQGIYSDAVISDMDGYKFVYPDWWFIVRKSGTEPLLRLVVETRESDALNAKINEISKIIQQ